MRQYPEDCCVSLWGHSLTCASIHMTGACFCGGHSLTCTSIHRTAACLCGGNSLTCASIHRTGACFCGGHSFTCASIHRTAVCLCGGHSLTCVSIHRTAACLCGGHSLTCASIHRTSACLCGGHSLTCTSIHRTAACLCGGHSLRSGYIVHSFVICFGSVRRMIPSFCFVHVHFMGSSSQSVILCITQSGLLHLGHVFMGTKCISASRLLVGRMSCMAAYHVDLIGASSPVVWRFRHMRFQPTARFFLVILISQSGFSFMDNCSRVEYMHLLKVWRLSVCVGGGIYAISIVYCCKCSDCFGILST
jgi:hypothetical protein